MLRGQRSRIHWFLITGLLGLTNPRVQAADVGWRVALRQPTEWYGTAEAAALASNVLAYQLPIGGWPKNRDMGRPPEETLPADGRDHTDITWATLDNDATTSQLRFLARVYAAQPTAVVRAAIERGVDYLLAAQYPNGGYPQFYPLRKGYYSRITFNDGAMIEALDVLDDVARARSGFEWIDPDRRRAAAHAVRRGTACILACQVRVADQLTVWCAQHDEHTLAPAPARKYEHVSLSGLESVGILRFLMERAEPSPTVEAAIEAGVAWFRDTALHDLRIERVPQADSPRGFDSIEVKDPTAEPLWARFYEIGTNRPLFSGRDGVKHYAFAEIEIERRTGYHWFVAEPRVLLDRDYPKWREGRRSNTAITLDPAIP